MRIYKVGGAVRDKLMGLKPKDNDWLVVGASIGAMPFALAMDFGYDLLLTIRLAALYPFLSAFLCFFFLRESQKLTDMRNLQ